MLSRFLRMAWKLCFHAVYCKVTFVAVVVDDLGLTSQDRPLQSKCIVKALTHQV